jgi:hypothetical protein
LAQSNIGEGSKVTDANEVVFEMRREYHVLDLSPEVFDRQFYEKRLAT